MGSPFAMKYKGVPALLKALVGKQKNLPENLKQAILDAPAKMYGKKDAPVGKGESAPMLKKKY